MVSEEYGFDEEFEDNNEWVSQTEQINQEARTRKSGYNGSINDSTMVSVINWYSYYEWKLYMVTLDAGASQLARCVEVKPVFKQEKEERYFGII